MYIWLYTDEDREVNKYVFIMSNTLITCIQLLAVRINLFCINTRSHCCTLISVGTGVRHSINNNIENEYFGVTLIFPNADAPPVQDIRVVSPIFHFSLWNTLQIIYKYFTKCPVCKGVVCVQQYGIVC